MNFNNKDAEYVDYEQLTFIRLMRFVCSLSTVWPTTWFVCKVGQTQMPNSSLLSLGILFKTFKTFFRKVCWTHNRRTCWCPFVCPSPNEVDPFLPSFHRIGRIFVPKRYPVQEYTIVLAGSARTAVNNTSFGHFLGKTAAATSIWQYKSLVSVRNRFLGSRPLGLNFRFARFS